MQMSDNNVGVDLSRQPEPSRKFQGVWIPASLWLRKDLTWFQKCLLAEVASLGECFASNAYLARMMGSSPTNVANELSKLRRKGLILDWGFDGRRRQITVAREVHPNPFGESNSDESNTSARTEGSIQPQSNKDTRKVLESEDVTMTSPAGDAVVEALWKPDSRTKEQKLSTLKNPKNFPSEREFDRFIEDNELDEIVNKRPDLYRTLCNRKWHHWNQKHRKWTPIRNWQEYVTALNQKIADVF